MTPHSGHSVRTGWTFPASRMNIRLYHPEDLNTVVSLWYRSWHHTFPHLQHPQSFEEWRIRFQDVIVPREAVWVAEANGSIAGFLAVVEAEGYLDQLFVDPTAQGQGVGTALMAKAKELSPTGLALRTLEQNRR